MVENLLRILRRVDITESQEDIELEEVHLDNGGVEGTCTNYIFLQINNDALTNNANGEGEYDGGYNAAFRMGNDKSVNSSGSSSTKDEKEQNTTATSLNTPLPSRNTKKNRPKLPPRASFSRHRYHLQ